MLIVNHSEVTRCLPMKDCIPLMRDTLAALARGAAVQPLRSAIRVPASGGILGVMPGYLEPANALGIKIITVFPTEPGSTKDSHPGAVLLFDGTTGVLEAVIEAGAITGIRTAAVSGVATDLLARPDAGDLAILGAGVQGMTHLEAMLLVRRIRRVRIWNRTVERARSFVESARERFGVTVEISGSIQEAVHGADIICTTTAAPTPILTAGWVGPGAHLNVVGSSVKKQREVDGALVARSRLFVDRRESAVNEAGDYLLAVAEGAIAADHIAGEIGEILVGTTSGRGSQSEITLFKSLGLAVEDVASARHIYQTARRGGAGTELQLDG
jgi:ornithine cyclodeaminase